MSGTRSVVHITSHSFTYVDSAGGSCLVEIMRQYATSGRSLMRRAQSDVVLRCCCLRMYLLQDGTCGCTQGAATVLYQYSTVPDPNVVCLRDKSCLRWEAEGSPDQEPLRADNADYSPTSCTHQPSCHLKPSAVRGGPCGPARAITVRSTNSIGDVLTDIEGHMEEVCRWPRTLWHAARCTVAALHLQPALADARCKNRCAPVTVAMTFLPMF
jgi:hypothetical protein